MACRSVVPCDGCQKRCSEAQIARMAQEVLEGLKEGKEVICPDRKDYWWMEAA